MSTTTGLEHIEEGHAYSDGEARQLYSAGDMATAKQVFFARCIEYSVGPVTLRGCLDASAPSVSLKVNLLGVTLSTCELSTAHQSCTIGGSVDGFKAEVQVMFHVSQAVQLAIDAKVCAPLVGCDTFKTTIPL